MKSFQELEMQDQYAWVLSVCLHVSESSVLVAALWSPPTWTAVLSLGAAEGAGAGACGSPPSRSPSLVPRGARGPWAPPLLPGPRRPARARGGRCLGNAGMPSNKSAARVTCVAPTNPRPAGKRVSPGQSPPPASAPARGAQLFTVIAAGAEPITVIA